MRSGRSQCEPASIATPPPAAAASKRHGCSPPKNSSSGGTKLQARAVMMSPSVPSSISSCASTTSGQYCAFSATMNVVPAAAAPRRGSGRTRRASAPSASRAGRAARGERLDATSSWRWWGTIRSTALNPPARDRVRERSERVAPVWSAIASARTGSGSIAADDVDARVARGRSRGGATPQSPRTRRTPSRSSLMPASPPRSRTARSRPRTGRAPRARRARSRPACTRARRLPWGCAARWACIAASASSVRDSPKCAYIRPTVRRDRLRGRCSARRRTRRHRAARGVEEAVGHRAEHLEPHRRK